MAVATVGAQPRDEPDPAKRASPAPLGGLLRSLARMQNLAIRLSIPAAMAMVFHLWGEVPLGWMLLAFLVGLPAIGIVTTFDDHLPGGWNNPDGTRTPPWRLRGFWGEFLLRASVALFGFAFDAGFTASAAAWLGIAVAGSALSVGMIRKGRFQEPAK